MVVNVIPVDVDSGMEPETYLGDGLYASFDGYQFRLRAPREREDHVVYLEPGVLQQFMDYVKRSLARGETKT